MAELHLRLHLQTPFKNDDDLPPLIFLGTAELGRYSMDENKEMAVTVRLTREEVGALDQLMVG